MQRRRPKRARSSSATPITRDNGKMRRRTPRRARLMSRRSVEGGCWSVVLGGLLLPDSRSLHGGGGEESVGSKRRGKSEAQLSRRSGPRLYSRNLFHCSLTLPNAFEVLESVGINLFLYPWKKEFKNIKTYTGPFVYYVKSTLSDEDIKQILNLMGYVQELGTMYKLKDLVDTFQVKMVSFELFLAKTECEQLIEIHLQVKEKGYSELDIVKERKNSNDDVRGCSDALKRRAECKENLNTSMSRMVLQKSASERGSKDYFKPKVSKPSKSVDTSYQHMHLLF
ncbi:spermatogenesis-associated protein 2 [Crotalus adamanteus]|uniref:Spermatogenesis-associated protein 2 n=1 Tax=Crotalus adamanteus TaxID=8729 RepID=A0AAW1BTM7_CROAD